MRLGQGPSFQTYCTQEDFDENLKDILEEDVSTGELLSIPGIYEILSEHFNNDVLDRWQQQTEQYKKRRPKTGLYS